MKKNIYIYTKPCFPVAMERHVQIEIDVLRVPDQEFQRARKEINARTLWKALFPYTIFRATCICIEFTSVCLDRS